MTTPDKVQIGQSNDYLDGVAVDTSAGTGLFRETVVLADPTDGGGLANVRQLGTQIVSTDRGIITNTVIHGITTGGGGGYVDVKVNPSGALTVEATQASPYAVTQSGAWTVAVSNFPATQAVSGTVNVGNFPATQAVTQSGVWSVGRTWSLASAGDSVSAVQSGTWSVGRTWNLAFANDKADVSGSSVSVSNFPATQPVSGSVSVSNFPATQPVSATSLPLPTGAATDATVAATNPYRGTTSYFGGASGTVSVPSGARVVSLSAHSVTGGSITIFGGSSIPVPANNGFATGFDGFVGPGNIVFTGTDSYYVAVNQ